MLTVSEAAQALGLSEGRTRALISTGKIQAEKRGRQWMVFERSVEQRKSSNVHAGRPRVVDSLENRATNAELEKAYSLYVECRNVLSHGGFDLLITGAKTEEEREFYVHVMNFFLARKCKELVAEGVF